jgi:hypothetical protein
MTTFIKFDTKNNKIIHQKSMTFSRFSLSNSSVANPNSLANISRVCSPKSGGALLTRFSVPLYITGGPLLCSYFAHFNSPFLFLTHNFHFPIGRMLNNFDQIQIFCLFMFKCFSNRIHRRRWETFAS